ncbi:MAG: hypothetical protein HYT64_01235 [Candidatus Yanofskybacteria bacterium]|nr:hypothetical protein [Candidatus Yanofskybacteria bacterium]
MKMVGLAVSWTVSFIVFISGAVLILVNVFHHMAVDSGQVSQDWPEWYLAASAFCTIVGAISMVALEEMLKSKLER